MKILSIPRRFCVATACLLLASSSVRAQDSAVINFTTDLLTLDATNFPNPLLAGPLASFAAVQPDVLRLDGQIWIQNYTGDGTYTAAFDNVTGNRILLHSPLLERIEAQTWRAEDTSDFAGQPGGPVEISGTAVSQRSKWLLPDDTPNGSFTVTVFGGQIESLNYLFDFSANSGLLFSDPNEGAGNPALANLRLDEIAVAGDAADFAASMTFAAGSQGFLDTAFGLNTQLDTAPTVLNTFGPFSPGVANGTVGNSTIGQLLNEISGNTDEIGGATPNISEDGRLNGAAAASITNPEQGDGYLADIFAGTTGNLVVFNGIGDLEVSVVATNVPEPSAVAITVMSLGALLRTRRR